MLIPITKIKQILDSLIAYIQADYTSAMTNNVETESFLYRVLYGNALGEFDFYTQGVNIFTRTDASARRIETRLGFDLGITKMPTIYVHQPAEIMKGVNTISFGADDNSFYSNADGSNTDMLVRGFGSTFEWVITSPNINEVLLIYEVLHAALISSVDSFTDDFNNINFTGKEYVARSDSMPDPLFIKAIQLDIDYTKEVPKLIRRELLNLVEFYPGIVYDGNAISNDLI